MNDVFSNFKEEFILKYPLVNFDDLQYIIESMISEKEGFCTYLSINDEFEVTSTVEKIHELQYNYEIEIKKNDDIVTLYLESGINNGTLFLDYCFSGSRFITNTKTIEVIDTIILNEEKCKAFWKDKYESIKWNLEFKFDANKQKILNHYKNQDYDNYVTGGGTIETNKYYNKYIKELNDSGMFFKIIYKQIDVDRNLK